MNKIIRSLIKSLALLLVLLTGMTLKAQLAPDFTITDTKNVIRSLYADHLNQGQTVVIKIFFVNCPPCNSIAADFQQLYESWGEGDYDVEFMELSNKTWDSNQDVANYQLSKGLSFIGAGFDGGSVTAVDLFTDGTFGQFTGTPTFIVIAPDGTVNFGVTGSGNDGKIAALDAAIAATGATGPNQTPEFTSFNVSVKDIYGNDLNNMALWLRSTEDPANSYNISEMTGGLLVFDYPSAQIPEMTDPEIFLNNSDTGTQNISGSDLVIIQRHILGLTPISHPLLEKAADINGNGSVSAVDLVQLINIILGFTTEFPNNAFWRYYFEDCNYCEHYSLPTALGQTLSISVTGVRTGDINY